MPTLDLPLRRPAAPAALHLLLLLFASSAEAAYLNYGDALSKSILFFEGQRSGYLPQDQRLAWRGNSGLSDGWTYNADLVGGYYDAGDNVKFGFPMAFSTTLLAWSVVEFGDLMPPAEMRNALVAIRWSTDYLLKTVSQPNRIFVQVRALDATDPDGHPRRDRRSFHQRPHLRSISSSISNFISRLPEIAVLRSITCCTDPVFTISLF